MWFFRRRQENRVHKQIMDIARKYEGYFDPNRDIVGFMQEYCDYGEEGLALDLLISWLYEVEIEPTEEERRTVCELAEELRVEDVYFWPEPPDDTFLGQQQ